MTQLKRAAQLLSKKGGQAQVPKGFSKMPKKKLKEMSKAAALKRWGKTA